MFAESGLIVGADVIRDRCSKPRPRSHVDPDPLHRHSTCFAGGTFDGSARAQHSRAGLHHVSGVTDAELLILSPFLPLPSSCGCLQQVGDAGDRQRPLLCPAWRHRLELATEGLSTLAHCVSLVRPISRRRHVGTDQPSPGDARSRVGRSRVGRSRGQSDSRRDRQPKRQDDRERRHPWLRRRQEDQGPQAPRHGGLAETRSVCGCDGRALKLQAHSAAIQDRDGAGPLLRASRASWPFVVLGYADGGYAGPRVAEASPTALR